MARVALLLPFFLLLSSLASLSAAHRYPSSHHNRKEKETHLHFFLHDTLSGKNPTAVEVARPKSAVGAIGGPTPFGTLFAIDDPLTECPELKPESVVGKVQGIYVSTGMEQLSLVMAVDYTFTKGEHKGSSFSVMSRNPISEKERELAVVGGRGGFKMARGFAELRTHSLNLTTGDAVIEYNVTLLHF